MSDETFQKTLDPQAFLRDLLREGLGSRRLFDVRLPAAGPQFFGREKELEALERDVLTGHCLGVFGLRKVGKTSMLRRISNKFRTAGPSAKRVIPVEVDLQSLPFKRSTLEGLFELIARRLDRELESAQIRVLSRSAAPEDRLVEVLDHLSRELEARLLLILDEYEVLLGGRIPASEGVRLLTWLRGVVQEHPGGFSLVLAGRNGRLIAPARIVGVDNPMYQFLRSVPLAGLSPQECRAMVKKIGARMALRFTPDALEVLVAESGGHPALARTLGNLVDTQIPTSKRAPSVVDAAVVKSVLPRFSRDTDEDMRELVNASNDIEPRAGDYLVHRAHEIPWIGGEPERRIEDALVGYGILHPDSHKFRIGRLAVWLRENHACPPKAAHG